MQKYEINISRINSIEAIKFRLEQMNLSETELSKIQDYRSRKSDILSGKRKLSPDMIRKLNKKTSYSGRSAYSGLLGKFADCTRLGIFGDCPPYITV